AEGGGGGGVEMEGEAIAARALLMDGQQGGIVRARGGEAGPDAARRFLATEAVGDGHDQGLGQFEPPRLRAFIWGTPCVRASHTKRGIAEPHPPGSRG